MKRRFTGALLALLALCLACFPAGTGALAAQPSQTEAFDRGVITGEGVAFRRGASLDAGLIRRLSRGTAVEILETNVNADFARSITEGA